MRAHAAERSRILFVLDSLWVGGTERSLVEMLPRLDAAGFDSAVVCLRHRDEGVEHLVPTERVRFLEARGVLGGARGLRALVRAERPTIVHGALWRSCLVSRLACVGLSTLVVNSLVNAPYTEERLSDPAVRRWRYRLVQLLDLVTARFLVDRFHAVSESVAAAARRTLRLRRSRITVIGRGRDPARLGAASAERRLAVRSVLGIPPEAPVVLSIGRQDYQKGQELLVRALAELRSVARPLLVVAGREGNATESLRRTIDEVGAEAWVHLLGHRDDVPDLLAASDVFAFPSRFEGYPGAVLEAMALGVPVVASDIGPVREIVEHGRTGLLAESGSVESLRDALSRALADRKLAGELAANAVQVFRERHTIEAVAARMVAFYRELAAEA